MNPFVKNIATILGALTLAYLGYYLYIQNKEASLSYNNNSTTSIQEMLANNQVFIDRRLKLDKVKLDTDIFMKPVFRSYRSYRSPEVVTPVGRENPFEASSASGI